MNAVGSTLVARLRAGVAPQQAVAAAHAAGASPDVVRAALHEVLRAPAAGVDVAALRAFVDGGRTQPKAPSGLLNQVVAARVEHPAKRSDAKEVELKLRLPDRGALERLAAAVGASLDGAVRQENRFFDAPDGALKKAYYTVRLRDEAGALYLTAKGSTNRAPTAAEAAATEAAVLKQHREEEDEIDPATAQALVSGALSPLDVLARGDDTPSRRALIAELRATLGDRPLGDVGAFTNLRLTVPVTLAGVAVSLELDQPVFPGDVRHYEVEVEIPQDADAAAVQQALHDLLASVGVEGRSSPGKAQRFFAALQGKPI